MYVLGGKWEKKETLSSGGGKRKTKTYFRKAVQLTADSTHDSFKENMGKGEYACASVRPRAYCQLHKLTPGKAFSRVPVAHNVY